VNQHGALVIGAGPAGLRAAEILASAGIETRIFEQKSSLGRKFLVAGRGGLNITHSEAYDLFVASKFENDVRQLGSPHFPLIKDAILTEHDSGHLTGVALYLTDRRLIIFFEQPRSCTQPIDTAFNV